ncbi:predicted protein [Streptomyces viridosporus ATCC 14672]|uniref:Predicted protein n=1 Tax=Streptomyces viridosporus (strain ATCC 14672 / DSM 40746 / JCM 4963 / KCTC 9882 / NRRL B-12104 / FH 1290) TaxID=566461 RepID=D5ZP02_STRV1|nr:predicted protein [Streptomyces viridosporus ATCC 14672]
MILNMFPSRGESVVRYLGLVSVTHPGIYRVVTVSPAARVTLMAAADRHPSPP